MKPQSILAVDLGGTDLRVGSVLLDRDRLGEVQKLATYPSPRGWDNLVEILEKHSQHLPGVCGCAISVAGPIADHGLVIKGPNLPWLDRCNIKATLGPRLRLPVVVSNDMEAAAEGERARGVLTYPWAVFDTISTGWGGVLLMNGEIIPGEPGHVNVGWHVQDKCGCGKIGCYEALYSGTAMKRRIQSHLSQPASSAAALWATFYEELDNRTPWACDLLEQWGEGVGRAWANVLNRIRPIQAIVYMGTTAENLVPRAEPSIRNTFARICMFPDHLSPDFPIRKAEYAERALLGAAVVYQKYSA